MSFREVVQEQVIEPVSEKTAILRKRCGNTGNNCKRGNETGFSSRQETNDAMITKTGYCSKCEWLRNEIFENDNA